MPSPPPTNGQGGSTAATVIDCYEFFDRVFPECGLQDLTEGLYFDNPATPYEQAQRNQIEWLLDEIHYYLLFIEMKSASLNKDRISKQFASSLCFMNYCDSIMKRFHKRDLIAKL